MTCPFEISPIIASILETGLLRIRTLAWSGQAERCATEADHIHNLPGLLADFSQERLAYYWEIERTAYVASTPEESLQGWYPLWERLRPHVAPVAKTTATAAAP